MLVFTLSFMKRKGIAIWPFIFIQNRHDHTNAVLLNHERIHLRQQIEMLVLPFYLVYGINYLYNLIQQFSHETAYRNIIFEQEAYDHEKDLNYLRKRKIFSFLNYL